MHQVLTADDRANTERELAALGLWPGLVDHLACGDDGGGGGGEGGEGEGAAATGAAGAAYYHKPHPRAATDICARFGVPVGATALVGDTATDMRTAAAAGLGLAVGVLTGAGSAAQLGGAGAHCVLDDVTTAGELILASHGRGRLPRS
jgi:phosphoglycolate phosphatase-like HAD superfamily hydrolase